MVGIVIVSHSRRIAEGTVELAREMGGEDVALAAAGGTDEEGALGTDAMRVLGAIEEILSDDGVIVLMDLGSAVMSAEMAVETLDEAKRERVLLCEAPLVEGAVAAATAARLGRSLEEVAREARGGLLGKQSHLGVESETAQPPTEPGADKTGTPLEASILVENQLGLHARPAARFVRAAGQQGAHVEVTNVTAGRGPVDAKSLNALATLGVDQHHEIRVRAWGPGAEAALKAVEALAADNFGDPVDDAVAEPPATAVAETGLPEGGMAGLAASPGVALAPARRFVSELPPIPTTRAEDVERELARLDEAVGAASAELGQLRDEVSSSAGAYEAEIFDAHMLMLSDETLRGTALRLIRDEKRNAADAFWTSVKESAHTFESLDNPRLRERGRDVVDIGQRVLGHLLGRKTDRRLALSAPGVLIVDELTPSTAAGLDPNMVKGIATATGGPTSHGAILARALGVPAVVGVGEDLLAVPEDTSVIVDGDRGIVIVDPGKEERERFADTAVRLAVLAQSAKAAAGEPATTRDGTTIEVAANIGSVEEARQATDAGADGVGLLRTEFLFLEQATMPTEEEQFTALAQIAEPLGDRPLTVRTLDVGADKPLAYLRQAAEENPFLGVRGIRLGLAERSLLKTQLKAIVRLAAERPVRIMFPMIATHEELTQALGLLQDVVGARRPGGLEVGIMIEVPSAALIAERLVREVDFFSIGTNDLSQYTLAAERGNAAVAGLADPLHPGVLKLISETTKAASSHDAWVGVCGELAGDARAAGVLLGLGVTELSMASPSIPAVKAAVRSTDLTEAASLALRALEADSAPDVRRLLEPHRAQ